VKIRDTCHPVYALLNVDAGMLHYISSNLSVRKALVTLVDRWGIILVCLANWKIRRAIITTGVGCKVLADTDLH
jgi:hypothetical protein